MLQRRWLHVQGNHCGQPLPPSIRHSPCALRTFFSSAGSPLLLVEEEEESRYLRSRLDSFFARAIGCKQHKHGLFPLQQSQL